MHLSIWCKEGLFFLMLLFAALYQSFPFTANYLFFTQPFLLSCVLNSKAKCRENNPVIFTAAPYSYDDERSEESASKPGPTLKQCNVSLPGSLP
jgi:hypothetical protein